MQYATLKSVLKFVAFASLVALVSGAFLSGVSAQGSNDSSSTTINAQVCVGGLHTPTGAITTPVSGTQVGNSSQTLDITTSWVRSYDVYRGATLLTSNNSVSYAANVSTSVTITLQEGQNNLHLVLHGGCPDTSAQSATTALTYTIDSATINSIETNKRSPRLTGYVSRTNAVVRITIDGNTYTAANNGDGTWTLPAGTIQPGLDDGAYDVQIAATADGDEISNIVTQDAVIIDTVAPTGGSNPAESDDRSPELGGTVDDPQATVTVTINGETYPAQNNGDGTWTLPSDVINSLASGTYDVLVTITDRAGNVTTYTYQLTIKAPNEIGFILSPNTGFLRINKVNIPSWVLYSIITLLIICIVLAVTRRFSNRTSRARQSA